MAEMGEPDDFWKKWKNKTHKININYERENNKNIDNGVYKEEANEDEIAQQVGARKGGS